MYLNLRTVWSLLAIAVSLIAARGEGMLAFPGAEGYGRFASGGRGGCVIAVTNLNDAGPGSLREAIEAEGARTIVFRIGGTIYLEETLDVKNGDLTIAGQTAPGDGICIARRGMRVNADNVIIRFLRVRLGDAYPREEGLEYFESDAFECRFSDTVIVDHCSFSWSIDECASTYNNANFTMQWCVVSESLQNSYHRKGAHGYGAIFGGSSASFHHNLLAHHASRNPRFNGSHFEDRSRWDRSVDYRNNVIYNWGHNSCYGGEPHRGGFQSRYNMVGNYYKPGPATERGVRNRIVEVSNENGLVSRFYIAGNYVEGDSSVSEDNWLGVDRVPEEQSGRVRSFSEFDMAPVSTQNAIDAYRSVLERAGAVYPSRDAVDNRVIEDVSTGSAPFGDHGIIDSQEDVGGYPVLHSGAALPDSDDDGISDAWEREHGLDPHDRDDGNNLHPYSGYTYLEMYLNGLVANLFN